MACWDRPVGTFRDVPDFSQILYDVTDHIATITLHRPDKMNAFTGTMMRELLAALDETDADDVERGFKEGVFTAVKMYPANATTNSAAGVTDYVKIEKVLARMEKIGMRFLIHCEEVLPDVDVFDREAVFIERRLIPMTRKFPGLKIVHEHMTSKFGVEYIHDAFPQVGASITPALIGELPGMGVTLALVPLFVLTIGLVGYPFFRRVMGYDHPTAFYATMPGGLQDMLVFGEEAGGNVRAMSLIHATRVLVIVTAAPFLLTLLYDIDLARAPGRPATDLPLSQLALMVAAGVLGWKGAERIGMFGASILGPLILTAALSLAGLIQTRPPAEMIWAAQFFIGLAVGSKYAGITARELRHDVTAGVAYAGILAVISLVFVEAALLLSHRPALEVLLSFLPGGQAEMAVIAIVAGADVAFVVAHHLTRIFLVILAAPVVARWVGR